ncbi:hypothetical protein P4478_22015 [Bacillus subtilis]|nr:hypothetical protein [Bacillus subtilis]
MFDKTWILESPLPNECRETNDCFVDAYRRVDKTSEDDLIITGAIANKEFVDAFEIEHESL